MVFSALFLSFLTTGICKKTTQSYLTIKPKVLCAEFQNMLDCSEFQADKTKSLQSLDWLTCWKAAFHSHLFLSVASRISIQCLCLMSTIFENVHVHTSATLVGFTNCSKLQTVWKMNIAVFILREPNLILYI